MISFDKEFDLTAYSEAAGRALLFSNSKTQDLIGRYGRVSDQVLKAQQLKHPFSNSFSQSVGTLKGELIKAMQEDLKK